MAIAFVTLPQKLQSVYNPIYFEVGSTSASTENFKYVFDIYTGTTATTIVDRIRLLPRPTLARAIFSPSRILENYLTYDLTHNTTGGTTSTNCIKQYYIYFGEEFGSLTTGVTTYANLGVQSGYTFNGVLDYETIPNWRYTALTLNYTSVSEKPFLTNSPSDLYLNSNERASLSYINFTSGDTGDVNTQVGKAMQVTIYQNSGGTTLAFVYIPTSTGNTTNSKYMHIGTGVWNLNNVPAALFTFGVGSQPVINTSTDYKYEITIWAASSPLSIDAPITETKTYNILPCTKFTPVRLMFLNPYGTFDYFSFNLVSRKTLSVNRTSYKQNLNYNYTVGNRGSTTLSTEAKHSMTVTSDWVTEGEMDWLQDLIYSKEVYELQSDGSILPIVITDSTFEPKKTVNDKIFNCVINYSYAYDKNTQRS